MRVNSTLKGFFNNRLVAGSGIVILMLGILLIATSFTKRSDRDLRAKETNIIIRDIGHRLLLQTGDRTSRVLPIIEIKEGTFQLRFEHKFAFDHDSLMALSQAFLPKAKFPSGYTVTVHDCTKDNIIYGFQINNNTPDILACRGRSELRGCYIIEFTFPDFYETPVEYSPISLIGSGMLMLVGFVMLVGRFGRNAVLAPTQNQNITVPKMPRSAPAPEMVALGKFLFDVKGQRLLLNTEVITLTDKECRILELLNANFGELIPRETLMEKIWLNEGVITGRSLDMFVSKLRKKLSGDVQLGITNVHGKGYKLEIL